MVEATNNDISESAQPPADRPGRILSKKTSSMVAEKKRHVPVTKRTQQLIR